MITYAAEKLSDVIQEMESLIWLHWEEIALNKDKIALDPDWEQYFLLEKGGNLAIITARDNGRLIGYAFWFIKKHIHYRNTVWAYNDVIFLKKEYRKGRVGLGLIDASEYLVKVLGADKIQWHIKATNDWTNILKRRGYVQEEYVMGRAV